MTADPAGRRRYIDEALRQIERSGGSAGVNLREVARALGCAHTNAYNYFDGLDDLLDAVLLAALNEQVAQTERAVATVGMDPRRRLAKLVECQVDFALDHPGWYRFVWLETRTRPTPREAIALMTQAGAGLAQLFVALGEGALSRAQALQAAEDFHTWLHGALAKLLSGRVRPGTRDEQRRAVVTSARRVLRALVPRRGER